MSQPLALFLADLHLQPGAWSQYPQIRGDAYVALQAADRLARSYRVPLVFCGDTFDSARPDPTSVWYYQNVASPCWYIDGNHDPRDAANMSWMDTRVSTRLHQHRVPLQGATREWTVAGLSYLPPGQLRDALAQLDGTVDILVTHQLWEEFVGTSQHFHADAKLADVPYAQYVISGDYHVTMAQSLFGKTGQPLTAVSPGSACMQSMRESPQKYTVLLQDSQGALSHQLLPLPSRPFQSVELGTPEALEQFLADWPQQQAQLLSAGSSLPTEIQRPILRVRFYDDIPEVLPRLQAATQLVHLCASARRRSALVVSLADAPARGDVEPLVAAVAECHAATSQTYQDGVRLLRSAHVGEELARMKAEALA